MEAFSTAVELRFKDHQGRTALVKRPDAKLLVLSTAPRSLDTPLGRVRQRALAGHTTRRGVLTDARASSAFEGVAPAVAMLIDENGKMVGRNGSSLNAGRDLSADYPSFKDALTKGHGGTDIWANIRISKQAKMVT